MTLLGVTKKCITQISYRLPAERHFHVKKVRLDRMFLGLYYQSKFEKQFWAKLIFSELLLLLFFVVFQNSNFTYLKNGYVDNFTSFFFTILWTFSKTFSLCLKKLLWKWKNCRITYVSAKDQWRSPLIYFYHYFYIKNCHRQNNNKNPSL